MDMDLNILLGRQNYIKVLSTIASSFEFTRGDVTLLPVSSECLKGQSCWDVLRDFLAPAHSMSHWSIRIKQLVYQNLAKQIKPNISFLQFF